MAIIKHVSDHTDITQNGMLPDQFVSEKAKQGNDYIKKTMDYIATIAHAQVGSHNRSFVHNYNLVKGILRKEDFYIKDENAIEYNSFVDNLLKDGLPDHVQHYSIMSSPLNIML